MVFTSFNRAAILIRRRRRVSNWATRETKRLCALIIVLKLWRIRPHGKQH
jgi:hypothetical protein